MRVFAIDPGNVESAYVQCLSEPGIDCLVENFAKVPNLELEDRIRPRKDEVYLLEMVASYGMAVGASVFETCVQIGRFEQQIESSGAVVDRVYRKDVKMHHCGNMRAKDSNIKQALIDKYAKDTPNHGKGSKNAPGFFYGFSQDIWQAFALAAYWIETRS